MEVKKKSLEEVYQTVSVSKAGGWMRRLLAFSGPAYMVAVGYMDPGNWATDLEGGARFGYQLIWVLLMANLMAILLQTLSARLGLVSGRDLAQACRESYSPGVGFVLWILCEIAIAACDLAEVLGTAIGLNLLFGLPLVWGVCIAAFDALLLLVLQRYGIRKMEGFILMLISTIGLCFILEIFLSKPDWGGIAAGLVPRIDSKSLYVAIGMLGATVMPHNLYLHSALVQSRMVARSPEGVRQACKYNLIDSAVALNLAFLVNAAILIVSSSVFFSRGIVVSELQDAHALLYNVLGTRWAPVAFAVALICAGQSSTLTGTLSGQIVMEGFLDIKIRPWVRRLITRAIAVVPSVIVIILMGDSGTYRLLILSQVILSLQLPFAIVPLIKFTSDRKKMGPFRNSLFVRVLAWLAAVVIIGLNGWLVVSQIKTWMAAAGPLAWMVAIGVIPVFAGLVGLLLWMMFGHLLDRRKSHVPAATSGLVLKEALKKKSRYRRIGVALEAAPHDGELIGEAIELARHHSAELVLMHVVEGVGGQWYGAQSTDEESRSDNAYLQDVEDRLRKSLGPALKVTSRLGFGDPPKEITRLSKEENIDLLIMGGHGHRLFSDLWRGQTIDTVRHAVKIPILAIRK